MNILSKNPKITIITCVLNRVDTIEDCILSVTHQTYANVEYIVIDGQSTDGTIDLIKSYSDKINVIISEPDDGIYSAMNKGISFATGDIIGFLHSDDLYPNNNVLDLVANNFSSNNELDGLYGDLVFISSKNTSLNLRYWKSSHFERKLIFKGWMPPHPTLFLTRDVYLRVGVFNTDFKISGDYEFIIRTFLSDLNIVYIPKLLYKMRMGGISNKSLKNIGKKMLEDFRAIRDNIDQNAILIIFLKNISKIGQFFKKK